MGKLAGGEFESLGGPANSRPRVEQRLCLGQNLTKTVARHSDEYVGRAVQAGLEVRLDFQVVGKGNAWQVLAVFARFRHVGQLFRVAAPQPDLATGSGELQCQRGSPGTRTEHCNRRPFGCHWEGDLMGGFAAFATVTGCCRRRLFGFSLRLCKALGV